MTREKVLLEHGWDHHFELFSLIKPQHMSDDETDRDEDGKRLLPAAFTIRDAQWMSDLYRTFMRTLDDWHYDKWANGVDGVETGGNAPRTHNSLGRVANPRAPSGLWRNCYNNAWLATLKPHQRHRLKIIDADYDFTLPTLGEEEGQGEE